MKYIACIIAFFFAASCAMDNQQTCILSTNVQHTLRSGLYTSGLTIRNSTRDDVFYLPYQVMGGESCELTVSSALTNIPYYLIFTNNPEKSAVVIKDGAGNIQQSISIERNEYENIWQTGNVYFKSGLNRLELSVSNVEISSGRNLVRQRASGVNSGGVTFLAQGGWQVFVSTNRSTINENYMDYTTRYNMWMDFLVSKPENFYELKAVIVNGPAQVVGKEYRAIPEASLNGVTKYGIDIVQGAGYQTAVNNVIQSTASLTFDIYINGLFVKRYTYDLINNVMNNTELTYNIGYYNKYIGYNENTKKQVFMLYHNGMQGASEYPTSAVGHKFYDGYWNIKVGQSQTIVDNLSNFDAPPPILCYLPGINSENLKYTNPYNSTETRTIRNTSMDSTVDIVNTMTAWSPIQPQILICHSHGGMRGMAYIKNMGANANKIKAIITIASPIKGIELLRGGLTSLSPKIIHDVDILVNGGHSIINALSFANPLISVTLSTALQGNAEFLAKSLFLTGDTGEGAKNLAAIFDIARGKVPAAYFTPTVLNQMDPKGEFARNYLGASQDGNAFSPILPSHVFVGQIVGHNNDVYRYAGNPGDSGYESLTNGMAGFATALAIAEGLNIATAASWMSTIWFNPFAIPLAAWYTREAVNSGTALDYLNHYKEYTGDLLGDRDNDSLIAAKSQQRTIAELGGRPISRVYIRDVPDMIHFANKLDKDHHPMVWGVGGGFFTKTISNTSDPNYGPPILWEWFNERTDEGWNPNPPNKMDF